MIPLSSETLHLKTIAEHWSREISRIRTTAEIHAELFAAVWQGTLAAFSPDTGRGIDRKWLLTGVNLRREHPGFVLVDAAGLIPPRKQEQADGSVLIDVAHYVVLPLNPELWTETIVSEACEQLSSVPLDKFNQLLLPALHSLGTSKGALGDYCDERGYERPAFWFGRARSRGERARSFGGRPSVMRQLEAEMRRRADAGIIGPSLAAEARSLRRWAEETINPRHQIPGPRSIENALRDTYRGLKSGPRRSHKT